MSKSKNISNFYGSRLPIDIEGLTSLVARSQKHPPKSAETEGRITVNRYRLEYNCLICQWLRRSLIFRYAVRSAHPTRKLRKDNIKGDEEVNSDSTASGGDNCLICQWWGRSLILR